MYQVLEAVVGGHRCCDLLLLEVKYALADRWRAQYEATKADADAGGNRDDSSGTTGADTKLHDGGTTAGAANVDGSSSATTTTDKDGDGGDSKGGDGGDSKAPTGQIFHRDNLTATGNYYVFVALHDIDSGMIGMIPGSQHGAFQRCAGMGAGTSAYCDASTYAPPSLKAGSVLIHSASIVHRGLPNLMDDTRYFMRLDILPTDIAGGAGADSSADSSTDTTNDGGDAAGSVDGETNDPGVGAGVGATASDAASAYEKMSKAWHGTGERGERNAARRQLFQQEYASRIPSANGGAQTSASAPRPPCIVGTSLGNGGNGAGNVTGSAGDYTVGCEMPARFDLSKPLGDTAIAEVRAALAKHAVIIFRDQAWSSTAQRDFTVAVGDGIQPNPAGLIQATLTTAPKSALEDGVKVVKSLHSVDSHAPELQGVSEYSRKTFKNFGFDWHTDNAHLATPSFATVLYATEAPPPGGGGGTRFADTHAAFTALPAEEQDRLSRLGGQHSYGRHADAVSADSECATIPGWADIYSKLQALPADRLRPLMEKEGVTRPLVRTHHASGRRCLYLGSLSGTIAVGGSGAGGGGGGGGGGSVGSGSEGKTAECNGWKEIQQLLSHATSDAFTYTHDWRPNDVVVWDNTCTLHQALPLTTGSRVMRRTSSIGPRSDMEHP